MTTAQKEVKVSRTKARYYRLKAEGRCTSCAEPNDNGCATCDHCLNCKRKHPLDLASEPRQKTATPTIVVIGGYCATPLCDVLEALELKVKYTDDTYHFTGSSEFTWTRVEGDTPFDALRHQGLIQ